MLRLTTGKMSSRTGDVITAESLLAGIEERAREKIRSHIEQEGIGDSQAHRIAWHVALSAVRYAVLRQATGRDIIFDPEVALSFEGDSGPYLQYAHTRALSILKKAAAASIEPGGSEGTETTELERFLYRFPEVVERAAREYQPHHLVTYLTDLAGVFNHWYAIERIVDETPAAPYKVALTKAFAATMKNGLWLLGIEAPEKM
jgi:arginyl-tRNA synthetase